MKRADMTAPRPLTRRQFAATALTSAAYVATHAPLRARSSGQNTIRFETDHLGLEIATDGTVSGIFSKAHKTEYVVAGPVATVFRGGRSEPATPGVYTDAVRGHWVYRGGSRFNATSVRRERDQLVIEFADAHVTARCKVTSTRDYLAFALERVEGMPIDRIEFLRLDVRRLPMLGEWVNFAYDDRFGVCLCAGTFQTDIEMRPRERHVEMVAAADAAVGFRGATAVVFGCPDPRRTFLDAMEVVGRDFRLPAGATHRRSPNQRLSYLWASRPDPQNIAEYIQYAKAAGFRMLLLSYTAFAKGAGHFEFNERYPNGLADLKRVTDAIRSAGLKTGLHIHYCKASKTDAYVTPTPDDRLHAARTFTLAEALPAQAESVRVRENPAGCTLDKDRRILKIGKELIEYTAYTDQEPFLFTGCRRGHLSTQVVPHAAGSPCRLLDVDTWPAFIRIDQNSDLQDEMAKRIAEIYHRTGPYDMVYFDGAEDVHVPYWYHCASAQYRVYRLLSPPPSVCEAPFYTHLSWHMITRANAYDANIATPPDMKDFCRLLPSRTAGTRALDFSRLDFGWLGGFGHRRGGYAGPDVYEYVASRAAAWDCPISLNASLEDFRSNPRADDCLAVMKIWEDARLGNHLTPADCQTLRNVKPEDACYVTCYEQREVTQIIHSPEKQSAAQRRILADRREHHLFLNEKERYELVEIEEVAGVAGGRVKAFVFTRADRPGDTMAIIWAIEGELRLAIPRRGLTAMRPFGQAHAVEPTADGTRLVVGSRTYLVFGATAPAEATRLLRAARAT